MDFLSNNLGFCLAENLRSLRKRMKLSQEELADRIGLNRGNIASYENGTAEPKICNLVKLSHLFKISVFDLTHNNLRDDAAYVQASQRHQSGPDAYLPALLHFQKEAADFEQAIKGLQCLFRLKAKNLEGLPPDVFIIKEQFEQLFGVTEQLLQSHLELLANIKEKCTGHPAPQASNGERFNA